MVKLLALLKDFKPTHFSTEYCRQVCRFVGVVRVIREQHKLSNADNLYSTEISPPLHIPLLRSFVQTRRIQNAKQVQFPTLLHQYSMILMVRYSIL